MLNSDRPLAGFEERRLLELQQHISAKGVAKRAWRPRRRLLTAVAITAACAVATTVGIMSVDNADSAYAITKDSNGIVHIKVRDFRDTKKLTKQLRDLGVPAIVDYAPPGQKCREPRATVVQDVPPGLYYAPRNIPGEENAWQMQINTKLFKPGQTFVWTTTVHPDGGSTTSTILMNDPVAPCELVPDNRPSPRALVVRDATVKGRSLDGVKVEGKAVGEILPEIEKRGLKVDYVIIEPYPGNPGGYSVDPKKQDTPVGENWVVWEAREKDGAEKTVQLVVTEQRYDKNPAYGNDHVPQ
ncbi:hypothetical protein SAMN05421505_11691 [Sinosporangium album]|uniref:Uncharacterized protein n=1 Tax=Sinosporangium album TaxID=504805 RepID=A0A1G8CP24_9ACTN|nr:hypothetical protein [Sinosporangium album]SDH47307.1 hypothetical protein SAMN05421505_11691 [Sinosporangium album]